YLFFSHAPSLSDIYTLSLHDALPISEIALHPVGPDFVWMRPVAAAREHAVLVERIVELGVVGEQHGRSGSDRPPGHVPLRVDVGDRKSTRLNSSHVSISYAVFCLKKK